MSRVLILVEVELENLSVNKLVESLGPGVQVEQQRVDSFHRLEEVSDILTNSTFDFLVVVTAGSSLLPASCAQLSKAPILGIAIESEFGGLDGMINQLQTAEDLPVLTCDPAQPELLGAVLTNWAKLGSTKNIAVWVDEKRWPYEYVQRELKRADELAQKLGLTLELVKTIDPTRFTIKAVCERKEVDPELLGVHVALFDDQQRKNPYKVTELYDLVVSGGVWAHPNQLKSATYFCHRLNRGR